jgi:hypothetical protein
MESYSTCDRQDACDLNGCRDLTQDNDADHSSAGWQ